jgi:DNA-binding NarL/FixJ family response regulator
MSRNVILVEDHAVMRSVLKYIVEDIDQCSIIAEAKCGIEALDAIKNIQADLVLLDLSLPDVKGVEVIKQAKKISSIKILVVTMQTDKGIIDQALEAGADGIILKDLSPKILKRAVLEVLDGKCPVYLYPPPYSPVNLYN